MMMLTFTLIIYVIFGMNNLIDTSVSSSEEKLSFTDYTKQDPDFADSNHYVKSFTYGYKNSNYDYEFEKQYETEKTYDQNNLNKPSKEKFDQSNKLKRKHKSHKTLGCEFCESERTKYIKSSISGKSLCEPCYRNELRNGYLVPLNERKKYVNHKNHTLVCEFCQRDSTKYFQSKLSGKALCEECYQYEYRNGHLIPLNERKKLVRHKSHILVCEFCQRESNRYQKGRISGKSLCQPCYDYERRNGHLLPLDERKKNEKHKNTILACEYCQKESAYYKKGKYSGQSLCQACYHYEHYHGHLIPLDERRKRENHKGHIVCEFCQQETNALLKGKNSGKSLCVTCYIYENRYGYVLPLEERRKNKKHKDHILVCEFCQREDTNYRKGKFSDKSLCKACYDNERIHGHLEERRKNKKHKDHVLVCENCQEESIRYKKGKFSGKSVCNSCYNYEYEYGCEVPLVEGQKSLRKYTKRDRTNRLIDAKKNSK